MQNFTYYTPTKVAFGKDVEQKVGELVREQGGRKALVHFGGQSAQKSGVLDRVCESLKQAGVEYVMLGGVVPNPRLSLVYEGISLCREKGVDFLLAVGGGSVIDSAKAIAYGLANDCDVWDLFNGKRLPNGAYPVGVVLTIAAAGSEMSNSCVITNDKEGLKKPCNSEFGRCRFAVMNPELTYTLPPYQTACGCADILMHTIERYFTREQTMALTDGIAETLLKTVMHYAKILKQEPENYEARAEVMWAGSLSHNGLTGCGGTGDFACHMLEHELSGMFDVAHGAGLTALWGSWARYVLSTDVQRFAQFAQNVMGISGENKEPEQTALEGISQLEHFFSEMGLPVSIKDLGIQITEQEIQKMADLCSNYGTHTIGRFKELNREDMVKIYHMAR